MSLYNLSDITKTMESGGIRFQLSVPHLNIARGEKIAIIAESGCGKSTLLDMLAFISQPTTSDQFEFYPSALTDPVEVDRYWQNNDQNSISDLRKSHIGYVMQIGGLLPFLTVRENINLSRDVLGLPDDGTAVELAQKLHISSHLKKLPGNLSLGERQRVAICRALAHNPSVVIADEPTASLDPFSADIVLKMFVDLVEELGTTLILASHSWQYVKRFGLRRLSQESRSDSTTRTMFTTIKG